MATLTKARNLSRQTLTNQPKFIFPTPTQKTEPIPLSLSYSHKSSSRGNSTAIYAELFKEYAEEVKLRSGMIPTTSPQINHANLSKSIYDFDTSDFCLGDLN